MPPGKQPEHEAGEGSPYLFSEGVTFGHSYEDLDMDQVATWYIAMRFGHIPDTIPSQNIQFTDELPDTNNNRLIIEGIPAEQANPGTGKVANGPNGQGAIEMYYDTHQRTAFASMPGSPDAKERLKELAKWLKYREHDKKDSKEGPKRPDLKKLHIRDMEALTRIFYALKLKYKNQPEELLKATKTLFDSATNEYRTTALATDYTQELADLDTKEQQDYTELERAAHEGRLQAAETLTGLNIAYFDIRGLGVRKGGMDVARTKTNADIIMLVDEKRGIPVIKFSVNGERAATHPELHDAAAILSDRLTASEALFGKGFVFTRLRTVGGHQNFTGMARDGSGVPPEQLIQAVQRFFDVRRLTPDQFQCVAVHFATAAGVEQMSPDTVVLPRDAYELATREMTLMIPSEEEGGLPRPVKIPEEDVPLYAEAFAGKTSFEVQVLLRQKTASTEPEEIRAIREKRAQSRLSELLPRKNGVELLKVLDDLNIATIRKMDKQQLVDIFDAIVSDPLARKQVWDKGNQVYRIRDPVFHHIDRASEAYRGARYRYKSVPQKVDGLLVAEVTETAAFSRNNERQTQVGEMLLRALTSSEYKQAHTDGGYDSLLASTLRYIGDARIPKEPGQARKGPEHRFRLRRSSARGTLRPRF